MDGKTLAAAAAAAGMCERTARRWQEGPLPSASKPSRMWRTRPDPFAEIWASDIVPRLMGDEDRRLQSLTLFEWLGDRDPRRFQPRQLPALQRRGGGGGGGRRRRARAPASVRAGGGAGGAGP